MMADEIITLEHSVYIHPVANNAHEGHGQVAQYSSDALRTIRAIQGVVEHNGI